MDEVHVCSIRGKLGRKPKCPSGPCHIYLRDSRHGDDEMRHADNQIIARHRHGAVLATYRCTSISAAFGLWHPHFHKTIVHYFPWSKWWLKVGVGLAGKVVAPTVPFKKLFFMEDALKFREAMPDFPFVYVGGVVSRETADEAISKGFPLIQMGRAVLEDTDFVNKMMADVKHCSGCTHSNFCIGRMYSRSMQCHKHCEDITPALVKEVARLDRQNDRLERKLGYK